jgi:hypothetical protein
METQLSRIITPPLTTAQKEELRETMHTLHQQDSNAPHSATSPGTADARRVPGRLLTRSGGVSSRKGPKALSCSCPIETPAAAA